MNSFSVLLLGNTWNIQPEISPSSHKHYKMPDVIIVPLVPQSKRRHFHMAPLNVYDIVILDDPLLNMNIGHLWPELSIFNNTVLA